MRAFFTSHAGKGTVGVYLAVLLIVWPPALSWLAAAALLWWAIRHLRLSFAVLEASARAEAAESASRDLAPVRGREVHRAA